MITVTLNQKQARTIAEAIFRDIQEYIRTHPEEYAAFIKRKKLGKEVKIMNIVKIILTTQPARPPPE